MKEISPKLRKRLESNSNVLKVANKSITYTFKFKEEALALFEDGVSANQIFSNAGIPLDEFPKGYARYCIKRWKKKVKDEGLEALSADGRGKGASGRPKGEGLDDLTREELITIIEIQREVLEERKKRRALAKKKQLK